MHKHLSLFATLAAALALAACGPTGAGSPATSSDGLLADTVAAATEATGTLLCAPSTAQVEACATLAPGGACALASADGQVTVGGTCRATLDGLSVGCAHGPAAPPPPLVEACAGRAAGDVCTAAEPDGEAHDGTCVTARDGATLLCGRLHAPPQVAVDACAALAAGDACSVTWRNGSVARAGVCSLGPASTGPLACAPPQALRPSATAACAGLAAGDACALGGSRHPVAGTCVTPAAGGEEVCQAACAAFGGAFRLRAGHGPGAVVPGQPPPPAAVEACSGLAAGDACALASPCGRLSVTGACRVGPDGAGPLACAAPAGP